MTTHTYMAVVRRQDPRVSLRDRTLRHPELVVFPPGETVRTSHGAEVVLIATEVDLFPPPGDGD